MKINIILYRPIRVNVIGYVLAVIYLFIASQYMLVAQDGLGTVVPGATLNAKLQWLNSNVENNGNYILNVTASENISRRSFEWSDKSNVTIRLNGIGGENVISLLNDGSLFTIGSSIILILNGNLTLKGRSDNEDPLIMVRSRGTLIMNPGVKITGNTNGPVRADLYSRGGGVCVYGNFTMTGGEISNNISNMGGGVWISGDASYGLGTFTMEGGVITGNTASYGGGVYISGSGSSNGTFIMTGGKLSGNTASTTPVYYEIRAYGGGVHVIGTFTLREGEISGNTSFASDYSYGGGVYVDGLGTFNMEGGTISGNTTGGNTDRNNGAGVCIWSGGRFNKTGGTIYGYTNGDSNSNVKNNSVILNNNGHAVFARNNDYIKRKETTAGPRNNLSFNGHFNPPQFSGNWDN